VRLGFSPTIPSSPCSTPVSTPRSLRRFQCKSASRRVDASKNLLRSACRRSMSVRLFSLGSTATAQCRNNQHYELYDKYFVYSRLGASKHSWRWVYHVPPAKTARRFLDIRPWQLSFVNFTDFLSGHANHRDSCSLARHFVYWHVSLGCLLAGYLKVKDNVTLNYGVRTNILRQSSCGRNQATNFIPAWDRYAGLQQSPGDCIPQERPGFSFFAHRPSRFRVAV